MRGVLSSHKSNGYSLKGLKFGVVLSRRVMPSGSSVENRLEGPQGTRQGPQEAPVGFQGRNVAARAGQVVVEMERNGG